MEVVEVTNVEEATNVLEDVSVDDYIPRVGLEFDSEEEAYCFYIEYGRRIGFRVRKDWFNHNKRTGQVTSRAYVCSKNGLRRPDKRDVNTKNPRAETRTNCGASMFIKFSKKTGKFQIKEFVAEHNHPLVEYYAMPPQRKFSGVQGIESAMAVTTTTGTEASFPAQCQRLLGKVALVTGGASGIGESIVRLFHKHGAKVCVVDIQDNLGKELCRSLGGTEGSDSSLHFFHCDVTSEYDVSRAVDFAVDKFGTLDVIVNNAGLAGPPVLDIRDFELPVFEKIFDVNVKGVFLGMKHAARVMIPKKKGSIISISSVASAVAGAGPHAYTASKHAVVGLTQNVAAELGKHGIRVNCVAPYAVPTALSVAHMPEDERTEDVFKAAAAFVGKHANLQGAELTASDVANAVLFLASDEARYISGLNLMVDGGFSCVNHSLRVFR